MFDFHSAQVRSLSRRAALIQGYFSLSLDEVAFRLSVGVHAGPKLFQSLDEVVKVVFVYITVEVVSLED